MSISSKLRTQEEVKSVSSKRNTLYIESVKWYHVFLTQVYSLAKPVRGDAASRSSSPHEVDDDDSYDLGDIETALEGSETVYSSVPVSYIPEKGNTHEEVSKNNAGFSELDGIRIDARTQVMNSVVEPGNKRDSVLSVNRDVKCGAGEAVSVFFVSFSMFNHLLCFVHI